MRLNLPVTAVEQTFGEQQRLISATDINSHITCCHAEFAATVQKAAGMASAAVTRGRELESISSGLRALVERFNR